MMQEQTIGQRIQLLRKAAALSQEALAAQVGVSRQAISKWEAGLSLPGIDNLQALAQVLCVSVDELLGGAAPAAQQLPPGESVALESVQALLLAQSEAERARRRRALAWKLAIAAPAVALVTVMMFTYQARLDDLQGRVGSLSGDVNSLHSTIQGEINGIRSGIEESLREQASLVASYDYTLSGYDQITHTVQLSVNAVAKQAVDGTSASFILTSPGRETQILPAQAQGNGSFYGAGRVPVTDELHISLSLLLPDGTIQNQELWVEYGLASQYMLQVTLGGERLTCTQANGVLQFDGRLALNIQGGGIDTPIYPVEARVELYIDGKLQYTYPIDVAWEPPAGTSDENAAAEIYGDVTYYIHPSENSQGLLPALPYTGGETIDFKAYVRDNLGQEYEVWFQNLGKPGAAVLP